MQTYLLTRRYIQADLFAFHEAHFSQHALHDFRTTFLDGEHHIVRGYSHPPVDAFLEVADAADGGEEYDEDDWTLQLPTPHDLISSQEGAADILCENMYVAGDDISHELFQESHNDGIQHTDGDSSSAAIGNVTGGLKMTTSQKKRRRRKNNVNNTKRHLEKPDLRKRTWDVVDSGLGSLDYDDMEQRQAASLAPAQRWQITYEDD